MARIPHHILALGRDLCPYCMHDVRLHSKSDHIYSGKDYGPVWQCAGCGAHVGCHPGTNKALGRVADKELRDWKRKAHAVFDPLWQWKMKHHHCRRGAARGKAYKWLAQQMGIDSTECHIGYFSLKDCKRVVEICEPIRRRLKW